MREASAHSKHLRITAAPFRKAATSAITGIEIIARCGAQVGNPSGAGSCLDRGLPRSFSLFQCAAGRVNDLAPPAAADIRRRSAAASRFEPRLHAERFSLRNLD